MQGALRGRLFYVSMSIQPGYHIIADNISWQCYIYCMSIAMYALPCHSVVLPAPRVRRWRGEVVLVSLRVTTKRAYTGGHEKARERKQYREAHD